MQIDFRNTNTIWASILVETLERLGLTAAVICPGSRSTPLTIAFAQHPQIDGIPILDERSAAFFALGMAKRLGLPVALVCTSGTAGANFYPAVIEAKMSRVPLLVLSADRPAELRSCHAGQTIDQVKLYGNYPNWQAELAIPDANMGMLAYLRQTIIQAWERSLFPFPGPVHLNIPFRDPLAPIPQSNTEIFRSQLQPEEFFAVIPSQDTWGYFPTYHKPIPKEWEVEERGIIIAGVDSCSDPQKYCKAIASLAEFLGWPVLAEALSPLRNYLQLNPNLISTYDLILRDRSVAQKLAPVMAIQLGELPTSKELRSWLEITQPQRWIVNPTPENFDPLHGQTIHLRASIEQLSDRIPSVSEKEKFVSHYLSLWCSLEMKTRQKIDRVMELMEILFEGKAAWLLSQILPAATPIFIANSMSVRYMEFFWIPTNNNIVPYFNRGANGIDGTLSTALGMAHRHQSSVILTGDLALLHDTNGFLIKNKFVGHLTIILINNNGGGIFEMLPIAEFEPYFEDFFATPQNVNFAHLCKTYGVEHNLITNWQDLAKFLNPLPEKGIRVLELQTDRKADASWLKENLNKLS